MCWSQMIRDVVLNDPSVKGSYIRQPFVNVIPIADGPHAGSSTLVYHNDRKGSPIGKGKRVRETDGPVYELVKNMEGRAAPYFWSKYIRERAQLQRQCVAKWMNCWDSADCIGWENTTWDLATGKVANKFLTRESSYADAVDDDFAAMGIDWRNHSSMVSDKEAVDAERADNALMEAKVIAAATDDRYVDDEVAGGDVCAASAVSCMSSYISMSSRAQIRNEDALRMTLSNARVKQANMSSELQRLQDQINARKKAGSDAFLRNWQEHGGTRFLNLEASACLPGEEEGTTILDFKQHMQTNDDKMVFQANGDDMSDVNTDIFLSTSQGVYLKAMKEGSATGLFK